ncbi:hypothetical protein MKY41_17005 [Sporosarcina sp. FSL W7-1349]|uniref:hypothetical protein n=1 Tax=Sporosarcina sp. FSL W7-1349 TaxID=2921561 RepID=UPI0030FB1356
MNKQNCEKSSWQNDFRQLLFILSGQSVRIEHQKISHPDMYSGLFSFHLLISLSLNFISSSGEIGV